MRSPDEAHPLFQRLADFLFSEQLQEFRRSASRRCESAADLLFAGGRRGEEDPRFFDYLVFSHRDADGRTGLDLFLDEEGPSLPPAEREAITRFRDSVYGLFEVEEFHRGRYLARRVGTDERFPVKTYPKRFPYAPGSGFMGRLVPFRDHYLETGFPFPFEAEVVQKLDPLFRSAGPRALRIFSDPVRFLEGFMAAFLLGSPPQNLRQAEVLAAWIFSTTEFPFTVEEVKDRFQRLECATEIFKECGLIRVRSPKELETLTQALVGLWNHLPANRCEGQTADGKHLKECRHEHQSTFKITFEPGEGDYGRVRVEPVEGPPGAGPG